jgi:hypothetical protein
VLCQLAAPGLEWNSNPGALAPPEDEQVMSKHVDALNPLTPNALQRRRAVSPLKSKIPSKNMREKPTNTPIIHSVY